MNVERNIPLISITGVSLSNLRDDWVVLHINNPTKELGDPVFSCFFKTEFLVHLLQRTGSRVQVKIASQIEYCKKLNKTATMKFVKDESIKKNDVYKSHTISVSSGEPADSLSDPPCPKKEPPPRPITSGKLLKAGGPTKSKATSKPIKKSPPITTSDTTTTANTRRTSTGGKVPPPPPPPPPPAQQKPPSPPPPPANPTFRADYDFITEDAGELPFKTGDTLEILQKDDNGWWLAKKDGQQGWVPSNYLKEIKVAPKTNPALPARRKPPPAAPQEKKKEPPQEFAAEEAAEEKEPAKKSRFSISAATNKNYNDSSNSSAPVPVFPGMAPVNSASGVPPWKAAMEAKKAAARVK
jgi:myosin-1